jgi:hypothetical protein
VKTARIEIRSPRTAPNPASRTDIGRVNGEVKQGLTWAREAVEVARHGRRAALDPLLLRSAQGLRNLKRETRIPSETLTKSQISPGAATWAAGADGDLAASPRHRGRPPGKTRRRSTERAPRGPRREFSGGVASRGRGEGRVGSGW